MPIVDANNNSIKTAIVRARPDGTAHLAYRDIYSDEPVTLCGRHLGAGEWENMVDSGQTVSTICPICMQFYRDDELFPRAKDF